MDARVAGWVGVEFLNLGFVVFPRQHLQGGAQIIVVASTQCGNTSKCDYAKMNRTCNCESQLRRLSKLFF
jgi:hypothetical protein